MIRFSLLPLAEQAILCKKVFTQAAAARILSKVYDEDFNSKSRKIRLKTDFEFVVWVHVPGKKPRFISKMDFVLDFIDFRTSSAMEQNLSAYVDPKYPHSAVVESLKVNGRNLYTLDLLADGIRCDCHDFSGQEQTQDYYSDQVFLKAFNKYIAWRPICKHIYKFLFSINLHSQTAWIENQRWADRWTVPRPEPEEKVVPIDSYRSFRKTAGI
ncbi:MAG: hypothetical protein F6K58_19815 [Symploca sp. SIO2E9]|nr:hypothetical protein [Symploca sp. SIO2E9]